MENKFAPAMAQQSDSYLKEILLNRTDWVQEAYDAARDELNQRGISGEDIRELVLEGSRLEEIAKEREEEPLETKLKVMYFVFSFVAFTPFVAFYYRYYAEQGYMRKGAESFQSVALGLLFYGAVLSVLRKFYFMA